MPELRPATPQKAGQTVESAKTEFLTLASHQLRTPVSAIKWYSELLLAGDAGPLDNQQREYIQQIYGSTARLNSIIDAMLLTANLDLGHLTVRPEPTDLALLCKVVLIDMLHIQSSPKKLDIQEDYHPNLPKIALDPQLTKTILRTVVGNAIKYTPAGGKIRISIQPDPQKLSTSSQGSLRIQVSDTGYGIPEGQQKDIFVKLFRAANIKEKDTDGTGLGLYVTKALLQQVGGRISFSSKENEGSTFMILLPVEGMAAREDANSKTPRTSGRGKEAHS